MSETSPAKQGGAVRVRGDATAVEVAAVVAVLAGTHGAPRENGYAHWRRGRIAALRGHRPAT